MKSIAVCIALGSLLVLGPPLGTTAAAQTHDEFQLWTAAFATAELGGPELPRAVLWLDVHARRGEVGTVHIVRPGVGLRLADFASVWLGYAWAPVFRDGGDTMHEHRAWQQLLLQHQTSYRLSLQSRTRLEQRLSDAGSDLGLRVRQLVRAAWQPDAGVPLGAVFWDEVFVGLNETDWGAPSGFDQNRLFIGPSLHAAHWLRVEIGYSSVFVMRAAGDTLAHVLALNLYLTGG
jgi:hypothetical protein